MNKSIKCCSVVDHNEQSIVTEKQAPEVVKLPTHGPSRVICTFMREGVAGLYSEMKLDYIICTVHFNILSMTLSSNVQVFLPVLCMYFLDTTVSQ